MQIKAVIFDMDGVLIDSEPHYNLADEILLPSLGIKFGEREIMALTGASFRDFPATVRKLNPDITLSDEKLIKMYQDSLMNALVNGVTELIDGVGGWIDTLKAKGLKIAVGSASHYGMVRHIIETYGINTDAVVTGSDVARGKPAPDIFLECARRLGVEPCECLVIEDSQNGVRAAVNAGMRCAAFTGTRCHDFDLSAADISIDAYDAPNMAKLEALL